MPHGSCAVGEEEGGMGRSCRGRQGRDHRGSWKPCKRLWYLSQEKLKEVKQENDTTFSLSNGEWNGMGQKNKMRESRATAICQVDAYFGSGI